MRCRALTLQGNPPMEIRMLLLHAITPAFASYCTLLHTIIPTSFYTSVYMYMYSFVCLSVTIYMYMYMYVCVGYMYILL